MPHYKDTENKLHWLDDGSYVYLLPAGSVPITDEEAEALRPKPVIDVAMQAKAYLASTDWYVTRFAETGKPIPEDVTIKRAEARKQVV